MAYPMLMLTKVANGAQNPPKQQRSVVIDKCQGKVYGCTSQRTEINAVNTFCVLKNAYHPLAECALSSAA